MSFSSEVKEELCGQTSPARHCQIAELAAIISICGHVKISSRDLFSMRIQTENLFVAKKSFTLLQKTFKIDTEILIRCSKHQKKNKSYLIEVTDHADTVRVLQGTKLLTSDLEIQENLSLVSNAVVQQKCCKRAFLRGSFLAAGSISDPERFYHFEIVCASEPKAEQLRNLLKAFEIEGKIVSRKKHFVVYIKEGEQIVEMLGVMDAGISLMKLENVRILKEMRNHVNRKVNCETANLNKTVSAAVKQIQDIRYIQKKKDFSELSEGLGEIARLRLQYPEASLKELGMMLNPPVGKSGVNHRLKKLTRIADELRGNKEEDYYD